MEDTLSAAHTRNLRAFSRGGRLDRLSLLLRVRPDDSAHCGKVGCCCCSHHGVRDRGGGNVSHSRPGTTFVARRWAAHCRLWGHVRDPRVSVVLLALGTAIYCLVDDISASICGRLPVVVWIGAFILADPVPASILQHRACCARTHHHWPVQFCAAPDLWHPDFGVHRNLDVHATVPFALVLALWLVILRVRVGYEEQVLSAEFGAYVQYKRSVWAFGPALVSHRTARSG